MPQRPRTHRLAAPPVAHRRSSTGRRRATAVPAVPQAPAVGGTSRRSVLSLLATGSVFGLLGVQALPAFAQPVVKAGDPAVSDAHDDQQSIRVASDVSQIGLTADQIQVQVQAVRVWVDPLIGHLTDGFGPRPDLPVAGVNAFHRGQDVAAPIGTAIHAAAEGTVIFAGWFGTYGNWVLVDHGHGLQTGYAHASTIAVSVGQRVRAGQVIAAVGSTGASTGAHLHFETHVNGVAVNPLGFMSARGIRIGRS